VILPVDTACDLDEAVLSANFVDQLFLVGRASELLRAVFSRFGRSLVFWKGLVENFLTRSREILFLDPKSVFRHGMENRA
jgi:hypothetical protein